MSLNECLQATVRELMEINTIERKVEIEGGGWRERERERGRGGEGERERDQSVLDQVYTNHCFVCIPSPSNLIYSFLGFPVV